MKKYITISCLACLIIVGSAYAYFSPGSPAGFVNDYAKMMSDGTRAQLETKLTRFEKDTSSEISVVTINSLQGDTIENFAVKLFKEWGIGKKDKDNGALLLIAKDDRQMRIEVGYGLEGALTDAQSYWIIQNIMRPAFQAENYDAGINGAVDKIIAATKGEYVPSETSSDSGKKDNFDSFEWFIFLLFLPIWLSSILARSKSWWAGGVIGAIIGVILIFVFSWIIGLVAILIFTPLGLLFDYIVSKAYQKHKTAGTRFPWWIGGFGGGRGGGFGGGGFGGFGGGSSGGGGASGRW